jgi:hypothetical protein
VEDWEILLLKNSVLVELIVMGVIACLQQIFISILKNVFHTGKQPHLTTTLKFGSQDLMVCHHMLELILLKLMLARQHHKHYIRILLQILVKSISYNLLTEVE